MGHTQSGHRMKTQLNREQPPLRDWYPNTKQEGKDMDVRLINGW